MSKQHYEFDALVDALRSKGPVFTPHGQPALVFDRLGIKPPPRATQVIQTLVATGSITMQPENDDPNADPRVPAEKLCDRYSAR